MSQKRLARQRAAWALRVLNNLGYQAEVNKDEKGNVTDVTWAPKQKPNPQEKGG